MKRWSALCMVAFLAAINNSASGGDPAAVALNSEASQASQASDRPDECDAVANSNLARIVAAAIKRFLRPSGQNKDTTESLRPGTRKLPIPFSAIQGRLIRLVNEAYKIDEAKTPAEKVRLGKHLASLAGTSKKSDERFVLLRRAAELARDAGHLPMMCQMIETIGTEFEMDTLLVQARMFDLYVGTATSPIAVTTGLDGAKELVNRALAEDRFDMALRVIDSAGALCERSSRRDTRDAFDQKRAEVERLQDEWHEICAAKEKLEADADDPPANFLVGQWLLVQKGDVKQGLVRLAKGSDPSFSHLAREELAVDPTDAESLAKLADAWWDLRKNNRTMVRNNCCGTPESYTRSPFPNSREGWGRHWSNDGWETLPRRNGLSWQANRPPPLESRRKCSPWDARLIFYDWSISSETY